MNCRSLTPRVLRWLRNGRPAHILNLFAEVCNLADDEGNVISLVSADIGAGPFSMIIDGEFTESLTAGMPITVDSDQGSITVGSLTIATHGADVWNPKPDWPLLRTDSSLNLSNPPPLSKEIADPLGHLLKGIKTADMVECRSGTYRLAGLGAGLTPTGDDVLLGVLNGLWVWKPQQELIRLIVETAVPRTTTLSAAFLKAAGDGEATIQWHNLVNGQPQALDQILAIGATSGRDAWAGFANLARYLAN